MHVFEMILGIVIIMTIGSFLNNFLKFKAESSETIDGIDHRLQKLEDLEQRIRTLEKIITDQNYDLDQKIKSL